jgi:hypothetical protein
MSQSISRRDKLLGRTDLPVPCIRHGVAGTIDPLLIEILNEFGTLHPAHLHAVRSLYLYEGDQVWATWRSQKAVQDHSATLSNICGLNHLTVVHLVPIEEEYDYQEDVPLIS